MRSSLEAVLLERPPGTSVAAFTSYELSAALGVLSAVTKANAPAVILVSAQTADRDSGLALIAALRAVVDRATVPVSLMLDHAKNVATVERSFAAGVDSVLADGSHLPFEENVDFTLAVARIVRAHGGSIEAELGVITGDEDRRRHPATIGQTTSRSELTTPDRVTEFVERTDCDALAVSVGNRHGGPPVADLDWALLHELRASSPAPLVLHGASGLSDTQLGLAVASGVAKVNINTQLRQAWVTSLTEAIARDGSQLNVDHMVQATAQAVEEAADNILATLNRNQEISA
jgi:tagatose 1,6-diphosphate aldolase GatY/KbaY